MKFIEVHTYYPDPSTVWLAVSHISAVETNTINENSRGSIIWIGATNFKVTETVEEILDLLEANIKHA
jgi:hypothetical protein